MSRAFRHGFCPYCGAPYMAPAIAGVTSDYKGGSIEKDIVSMDFFTKECPKCSLEIYMNFEFSYNDLKHHTMIWSSPNPNYYPFNLTWIQSPDTMPGYKKRVVSSTPLLSEKVAIFSTGRDDRILELCKYLLVKQYNKQNPEFHATKALYTYEGSEDYIYLYNDKGDAIRCLIAPYMTEILEEKYRKWLDLDKEKDSVFINSRWAERFVSGVINDAENPTIIGYLIPDTKKEKELILKAINQPIEGIMKENAFEAFLKRFKKE